MGTVRFFPVLVPVTWMTRCFMSTWSQVSPRISPRRIPVWNAQITMGSR